MRDLKKAGQGVTEVNQSATWPNPAPSTPRGMRRFDHKNRAQQDRAKSIYGGPGTKTGFARSVEA